MPLSYIGMLKVHGGEVLELCILDGMINFKKEKKKKNVVWPLLMRISSPEIESFHQKLSPKD